jgi:hypothetical protein
MKPGSRRAGLLFLLLAAVCGSVSVPAFHAILQVQICCPAKRKAARVEEQKAPVEPRYTQYSRLLVVPAERTRSLIAITRDALYQRPPPNPSRG